MTTPLATLQTHEATCPLCGNDGYKLCPVGLPLVIKAAEVGVPWLAQYKPATK